MLQKIVKPKSPGMSFSDLIWFSGYTPSELKFVGAKHGFTCFCYVSSTPIEAAVYFHVKTKIFA